MTSYTYTYTYTREQIRAAILRAADTISDNPKMFDFDRVAIPDCGTPGCALGWIGYHLGIQPGKCINAVHCVTKASSLQFYGQLDKFGDVMWHKSADGCARALRLYADAYFPAATTALVPFSQCSWRSAAIARLKALPAYSPTLKDVDEARETRTA